MPYPLGYMDIMERIFDILIVIIGGNITHSTET